MTLRRAAAAAALAWAIASAGCAKSVFPPGGPIDKDPPRVLATVPADSSTSIPVDAPVEFLFSEAMDRPSVRDAVKVFPPPPHPNIDWSGRRFRLSWRQPLEANTTYHVLLSGRARDAHGVVLGMAVTVRFSTGDSLAPGRISGRVATKTLPRYGVRMVLFPDSLGSRPDTSDFIPMYETETDTGGVYVFSALGLNRDVRVFAFFDRIGNGTYEEDQDVLVGWPEAIRLTPERAVADSINLVAVDPRAPAILSGTVESADSTARFQVEARGDPDSTVFRRVERTGPGPFSLRVPAGRYRLRAIRPPGPGGVPPRLELGREEPLEVEAEEEVGGLRFDFRPLETEVAPAPGTEPPAEPGTGPETPPGGEE